MTDPHKPLRDDVRLLGELLGDTLRAREGDEFFERIELVRATAKAAHEGVAGAFDRLADLLRELPLASAVPIARAFAHFLMLANVAEQHHRVRRRRDYARSPDRGPQPASCEEAFPRLRRAGISAEHLAAAVASLRIELVLTAHPTEIVRRTIAQAQRRIADLLARRDRPDLTPSERADTIDRLRREIAIVWQTEEARDRAVTPLDEVRAGLVVFEQTLWEALPRYLRAVDRALRAASGVGLPIEAAPIRFGSWIGGDRDGNPNVTPEVTRQATWLSRWMAADLYLRDLTGLREDLSLNVASDALRERVGGASEPYRALLREVIQRLEVTRAHAAAQLDQPRGTPDGDRPRGRRDGVAPTGEHGEILARNPRRFNAAGGPRGDAARDSRGEPYLAAIDLAEPLWLCYRSLVDTGNQLIADGRLADTLRRVAAFGLTLARLDLRQESSRHADAVAWIAEHRRLGRFACATESERTSLLVGQLAAAIDPLGDDEVLSAPEPIREVFDTFRTAAALQPESLGAYVITMTHSASDVLAVEFLQRLAGNRSPQRVVPLFETADDLAHAAAALDALLDIAWYRDRIGSRIEVMIGYSDSAKDAGRLAAAWSLYLAQEQIVAACRARAVGVTLFHGRGGSIGRGGGPTWLALQSQPPGSVDGTLRVTEQGEMIQAKFGVPDIAVRTLEVYTTATLDATLAPAKPPAASWRECMARLSEGARAAYRGMVHDEPQFVPYFRTATPEPELRLVRIGSRPARRAGGEGVESLRAIPWQFAWTQTRLLLASWLGVEAALGAALGRGERELLREMYQGWPFFRSTLDLIEMVLAKADARIAAEYDRRLVSPELQPLGSELRARLAAAIDAVLDVTGHRQLVETNRVLRRSIDTRNPYVDPINVVQIELLERLRESPDAPELRRAFAITVNGIAAGMRNTG